MATLQEKLQKQVQEALTNVAKNNPPTAQTTQPSNDVIDLGAISNAPKLNIPPTPLDTVNQGIQNLTTGFTQAEQNQQDIGNRLVDIQRQFGQKAEVSGRIGEELGIGEAQTRATEAANTVGSISTQMKQAPLVVQEEAAGRGQTRFTTNVRESDAQRLLAIKGLTAVGEYDVASRELEALKTEQARILDMEFAPLEAEQKALETFYAVNKDTLERQDSKQAQQLSIFLDERKRLLDDMKQVEQTKQNFQINAQANGADARTVQAIQNAESIEDAIVAGGQFVQDPQTVLAKQQFAEQKRQNAFSNSLQIRQISASERANNIQQAQLQLGAEAEKIRENNMLTNQNIDLENKKGNIEDIIESPYFSVAFGSNFLSRGYLGGLTSGISKIAKGDIVEGVGDVKRGTTGTISGEVKAVRDKLTQIISRETLTAMESLKGTPSDKDAQIAIDAATNMKLNSSEKTIREELPKFYNAISRIQETNSMQALTDEELVDAYNYINSLQ